jgi:hypothetical protein
MYFAGDEICLSVRSFTLGYDIYHPHINLVYHHYGRLDRAKHWSDHNLENKKKNKITTMWSERDSYSKKRIRQLLTQEDYGIDLGVFGLGTKRSIQEYEKYSGIDFKNKRIQKSAISGMTPPVLFENEINYEEDFRKITETNVVEWDKEQFLQNHNKIHKFNIQYMNLQKNIIFNTTKSKQYLLNTEIISNKIVSDYVPMKIILQSFDSQNNLLCMIQKDLQPNIHWN